MKMDPTTAKKILELRRRNKFDVNKLFAPNFPQQRAFIEDPFPYKALFCTRRSAKSYTAGLYLVHEALKYPGCNCLFVALTRATAWDIVFKDILCVINKKHNLGAVFNLAKLTMKFPNGSIIAVTGIDADDNEMKKLLGRKMKLVCIDEASMYTVNLRKTVNLIEPSLKDERGTLCLSGTASNFTRGLFYDITTGKEQGWHLHSWDAFQNPFVAKQHQEQIDFIKEHRPLYMETPQYKQWYLNKWEVDEEKLVYRFNEERNLCKGLPGNLTPNGWTYILGVDTGWEDDNAFVLTAYHENDSNLYIVKTFNKNKMIFADVAAKIEEFMADHVMKPSKVIIDGANKQGVESMRFRSSIPFEYAEKTDKATFIELLNSDLIQGKIKLNEKCTVLRDEMMSLVWKTDKDDKISFPRREHPALPNHLCDALLYSWRNGYHYLAAPAEQKFVVGSKDWYLAQSAHIWEHEAEQLKRREEGLSNGEPYCPWGTWGKD